MIFRHLTAVLLTLELLSPIPVILSHQAKPAEHEKKPSTFTLSEVQHLRLEVKQRDTELAGRDLQSAQVRYSQVLHEFTGEAERIKKENAWPDSLQFDPRTLTFTEPAPAPADPKAPQAKKP